MFAQSPLEWLLLGIDSLVAGVAIGPLLMSWRARLGCALAFGACDGIASWIGGAIPHQAPDVPDAVLYLACVPLVALGAMRSRAWLFAMPLVMSIDNLATGAPAAEAVFLGLSSGVMALVGLLLGMLARTAVVAILRLGTVR